MKITRSIQLEFSVEDAWNVLTDGNSFGNWNPWLNSVEGDWGKENGNFQLQGPLWGGFPSRYPATITGWVSEKYLSFQSRAKLGTWWLNGEFVFRFITSKKGMEFFCEVYAHGLKMRFGKNKMESDLKHLAENFQRAFLDRLRATSSSVLD